MRPVQTILLLAVLALSAPVRADQPVDDGEVRLAIRDALAEKATLPALRPSLPSLLSDRDGQGHDARTEGSEAAEEARGEAERSAAGRERANAHSAAARKEAAAAAAAAAGDERGASEHLRVKKVKKEHVKPPHPVTPEKLRP